MRFKYDFTELCENPIVNIDKQSRYSSTRIVVPENVAEHSSITANVVLLISRYINFLNGTQLIDVKDAVYRSVIHDYGESVTCDITTDVKNSDPRLKPLLDEIENNRLADYLKEYPDLLSDIQNAKKNGLIGLIVEFGDRFSAVNKLRKEHLIQRTNIIKGIYITSLKYFEETIKALIDETKDNKLVNDFFKQFLEDIETELIYIRNIGAIR